MAVGGGLEDVKGHQLIPGSRARRRGMSRMQRGEGEKEMSLSALSAGTALS